MNPCPCGFYSDPFRTCTCSPGLVSRYQQRISGPFIDRVDIFIEVPHIEYEKLTDDRLGEESSRVQTRVKAARARQQKRFSGAKLTCKIRLDAVICKIRLANSQNHNLYRTCVRNTGILYCGTR